MEEGKLKFLGFLITKFSYQIDEKKLSDKAIDIDIKSAYVLDEENYNFGEHYLDVDIHDEGNNIQLKLSIKGGFEKVGEYDNDTFEKMIQLNGAAILFPYIRCIISSFTANANIAPIILPLINVNSLESVKLSFPKKTNTCEGVSS